ncbi:hypothetical protein PFICI_11483 [Pestalotiopsis fici W106-1]|uniref:Uncharacterized protein n=1 Tax=Pestalotiopsis fici (strain W106-1 / CGMCC3.15140) TaxID=1229662 RepID=W3WTD6_PESFW|nr:uncharacterized protein PFICI_11483 [Pestalotiopsis fici W106-1]ETS76096.1 hypothetical protein PFICI_11483 [Pestalotiopsis fici W106-1]
MARPPVIGHWADPDFDPQMQSPLFNILPSEIRDFIFRYALQEYCSAEVQAKLPNLAVRHDHEPVEEEEETPSVDIAVGPSINAARRVARRAPYGYDWLRPDNVEPMTVTTALLRTCRRVYIEAYELPAWQREHRFYMMRGDYGAKAVCSIDTLRTHFEQHLAAGIYWRLSPTAVEDNDEQVRLGEEAPQQQHPRQKFIRRGLIRRVRLFTQLFWLEDSNSPLHFWRLVTETPWLGRVEHLRITIRRGDWWNWESKQSLSINPFRGTVSTRVMSEDIERAAARAAAGDNDINPDFSPRAWGLAFQHLRCLETLTIDFETAEDQRQELDRIVEWAVGWKLPLAPGLFGRPRFLSAQGRPVEKMSWRGQAWHSQPGLFGRPSTAVGRPPRLYVSTVTWVHCEDRDWRRDDNVQGTAV